MMQNIFGFPNPDNDNNVGQNEAADAGWTPWSECSNQCGSGSRMRSRICSDVECRSIKQQSNFQTLVFPGGIIEMDNNCNSHSCPVFLQGGHRNRPTCKR